MTCFAKLHPFINRIAGACLACMIVLTQVFQASTLMAHPLEYHLDPLDEQSIERVLTSFDLLAAELEAAGLQDSAQLSGNALGITAIVWSTENAIADMDDQRPVDSPALLNALTSAGYEDSPYMVAEWQMEAERIWEAYEVLTANFQVETIGREMKVLEQEADELTPRQRAEREAALIRKLSMLQTTAGDISQVAPYRQRLDELARRLGN